MRKTPREILKVKDDDRHAWLLEADIKELSEFLTLVNLDNRWSTHGRDALNILLAKENIKLQTDIRDMTDKLKSMTKWVTGLTVLIAFLTLIQAYSSVKTLYNDIKSFSNSPKAESTTKQPTKTTQLQDKNNHPLNKTEVINHK